jgi:hypothetical protein
MYAWIACPPSTAIAQGTEWTPGSSFYDSIAHTYPASAARFGAELPENTARVLAPPSNDNCSNAINLVPGATCTFGTTLDAGTQLLESLCILPGLGILSQTVWYSFIATNDSMVVSFVQTNTTNCATYFAVYGPFSTGGECLPTVLSLQLCQNMGSIDPGYHPLMTGLTLGQKYMIQVQGNSCLGSANPSANFCVSVDFPARSARLATAPAIDSCNFAYTGNNGAGQWANGSSTGNNNLDFNNTTTAPGVSETGDDVTYVINNAAWMRFCNGNPTSCLWNASITNINSCLLHSPNNGLQMAVFSGTPTSLTSLASSPSRIPPGTNWHSGNFSIAAGGCAYLLIDGFAGDECNYSLSVGRVDCPCLLPITLTDFNAIHEDDLIRLTWRMEREDGVRHYRIDRSENGLDFTHVGAHPLKPFYPEGNAYELEDRKPLQGWNLYRITAIEQDGAEQHLSTVSIYRANGSNTGEPRLSQSGTTLYLRLPDESAAPLRVSLIDLQGRIHHQATHNVPAPGQALVLPADQLGSGVFLIKVEQAGRIWSQKFMIP